MREGTGVVPASFCAGAATFWYNAWQDSEWVRYRRCWMSCRRLEIYIQEALANAILVSPSQEVLETISIFASAAAAAMAAIVATLLRGALLVDGILLS